MELKEPACNKCIKEITNSTSRVESQPCFGLSSNFGHGMPIPECFKNASYAEISSISIIQVIHCGAILKNGSRSVKGHLTYIDRTNSINEIATVLPRLANEIDAIFLKRRTGSSFVRFKEFKLRKHIVQQCLEFLIRYSPAYSNIRYCPIRLSQIPDDDYLDMTGNTIVIEDESPHIGEDTGPALQQFHEFDEPTSEILQTTELLTEFEGNIEPNMSNRSNLSTRIISTLDRIKVNLGVIREDQAQTIVQEYGQMVNWRDIPFFFAKAFPHLFMPEVTIINGVEIKDIPADYERNLPRTNSFSFYEYSHYLTNALDGRYSNDHILKFVLLNIKQREQSLSNTAFGVEQMEDEEKLTKSDFFDILLESNGENQISKIAQRINTYSRGIGNTPAFWFQQKRNVSSMVRHIHFESNQFPLVFHSGSMAEYH